MCQTVTPHWGRSATATLPTPASSLCSGLGPRNLLTCLLEAPNSHLLIIADGQRASDAHAHSAVPSQGLRLSLAPGQQQTPVSDQVRCPACPGPANSVRMSRSSLEVGVEMSHLYL